MTNLLLSINGLVLGLLVTLLFEMILKTNKKLRDRYYRRHEVLLGYHVHHSTFGLVAFFISIWLFLIGNNSGSLFVVWFGVGIIIVHTISDGRFVFIDKQKK